MTLDGGWGLIIAGMLVLIVGAVGTLIWRHVDNAQKSASEAHEALARLAEKVHAQKEDSLRFETHVANTYARLLGVERMETNIFAVMARFETKLDTLLEYRSNNHG
ncbi:hypothetical protein [Paraburkholderia phenazinium]|uniref:Uncharacterized protein n=1 Tax=Paraburkholderia phenazinium TaxID=60549 RepID=A0A1N6KPI9_9BURK|nr:hypothetical protein [Paraburkholderia phenazinium]SIO58434.1 hypothetical protein SAMN05444165_4143 [Paraburkholderia phenazinium]